MVIVVVNFIIDITTIITINANYMGGRLSFMPCAESATGLSEYELSVTYTSISADMQQLQLHLNEYDWRLQ